MKNRGFSTIIAVVIAGAVGLSVVLTLSMLAISSNRIGDSYYYSKKTTALLNSCVTKGLLQTRENTSFTGYQNLEIDGDTCNYSISYLGATKRQIEATATIKNITKKARVTYLIDRTKMVILDWKEVSDL
jgi:hypothetical protein